MKARYLISGLLFIVMDLFSQTVISDSSFIYGTWTLANSPYLVEGEAIVPEDSTLIIEPGVTVQFQTGMDFDYSNGVVDCGFMRIEGVLQAVGTAASPITFTRNGTEGNWGIIFFDYRSDDGSVMKFCDITYGNEVTGLISAYQINYGAITCYYSTPSLINCRITDNASSGICHYRPINIFDPYEPIIKGCLIANNGDYGFYLHRVQPIITNVTIAENGYKGFYCDGSPATIKNSVMWGNSDDFSFFGSSSPPKLSYSLIQSAAIPSSVADEGHNITGTNPMFVNPANGDYAPRTNSFLVHSGTPDTTGLGLPAVDLNGNARIVSGVIDIGAYESQDPDYIRLTSVIGEIDLQGGGEQAIRWQSSVSDVKLSYSTDSGASWTEIIGSTPNDGSYTWNVPTVESCDCQVRINDALNDAMGDTSRQDFCIYTSTIADGMVVSGTWLLANSPLTVLGEVIIPQDSTLTIEPGVTVQFKTGTDFNYYDEIVDCGFMRVNGRLTAMGTVASPITFTRDGTSGNWGIVYFSDRADDQSIIKYCQLEYGNKISRLYGYSSFLGVLSCDGSSPRIERCAITNNAWHGIHLHQSSSAVIINNLVAENVKYGISISSGDAKIISNTIAGNGLQGLAIDSDDNPTITNTIVWGNGSGGLYVYGGTGTIRNSLLQNIETVASTLTDDGGNLVGWDPQFLDAGNSDYRIGPNSFAVHNGTPDTTGLDLPDEDLAGNTRIISNVIDIGAYESQDTDFIRIVSPNGDEAWMGGSTQPITWQSNVANVKLEYSTDGGFNWTEITGSTPNDSSYTWTVPAVESGNCLIRVSDAADPGMSDTSDDPFFIYSSTLPDGAQVFGTWTLANSPYVIEGEVIIPEDSTLTIEPSVTVQFQTGTDYDYLDEVVDCGFMRVSGRLTAVGTAVSPITFTRDGTAGNWGIVYFANESNDSSAMSYCRIEYGNKIANLRSGGYSFDGAVSLDYSSPRVENCQIIDNQSSGIYLYQSEANLVGNLIAENGLYGIKPYISAVTILNNTVVNLSLIHI